MTAPSTAVCRAFGCDDELVRLAGGEGRSWRSGNRVLKATSDEEQAVWIAEVLGRIASDDIVIPEPIPSRNGSWVVDGWACTEFVEADHEHGRWLDVIAAGRTFHSLLLDVPRPEWIDRASDWWRRADDVAWGTRDPAGASEFVVLVRRLLAHCEPLELPEQVIHADLCGNVLFDQRGRPVIIDFTPYFRPAEWASAVVAVDAFEWENAGPEALDWLRDVTDSKQLLLRAAIFRIATSAEVAAAHGPDPSKLAVHRATVEVLEGLPSRSQPGR